MQNEFKIFEGRIHPSYAGNFGFFVTETIQRHYKHKYCNLGYGNNQFLL
jgi:hypothetical protein